MSNQLKYRYPGAQPFQTDQKEIFYGRVEDIADLHQLINLENLVVLYAKSGLGKSSIINAGLIPEIRKKETIQPFSIRFFANTQDRNTSPLQSTIQQIEVSDNAFYLNKLLPADNSLWCCLKKLQLESKDTSPRQFILIFDQFEEIFTYSEKEVRVFKQQLSELLNRQIPQRFLDALEQQYRKNDLKLSEAELEKFHQDLQVKVLLAIRSDRLSLLNDFSDYLPNILKHCKQLLPLNAIQAEDSILSPAYNKNDSFHSTIFDFEDDALDAILSFLTKNGSQPIESFQLQILCQNIEQRVIDEKLKLITREDIGDIESIYKNHYDNLIANIGTESEQLAARTLIEEGLIFEEEERRVPLYEGQVFKNYGVSEELLKKLVDSHLLRAEASMQGGYTYELCHDTLVGPVLEAKKRRFAALRKAKEEAERAAREKEAEEIREEMRKQEIARQKEEQEAREKMANLKLLETERAGRRKARRLSFIGFILAGLALFMGAFSYLSYIDAKEQRDLAIEAQIELEKSNKLADSLRLIAEDAAAIAKDGELEAIALRNQSDSLAEEARKANGRLNIAFSLLSEEQAKTKRNLEEIISARDSLSEAIALAEKAKLEAEEEKKLAQFSDSLSNVARKQSDLKTKQVIANDLAFKAAFKASERDISEAFRLAEFTYKYVDTSNFEAKKVLYNVFYQDYETSDSLNAWESQYLLGNMEQAVALNLSKNNQYAVVNTREKKYKVWDLFKKEEVLAGGFPKNDLALWTQLSADGSTLYVNSSAREIKAISVNTGTEERSFIIEENSRLTDFQVDSDKNELIAISVETETGEDGLISDFKGSLYVWNLLNGELKRKLLAPKNQFYFAVNTMNRFLISASSKSEKLKIRDLKNGANKKNLGFLGKLFEDFKDIAFSTDGSILLVIGKNYQLNGWRTKGWKKLNFEVNDLNRLFSRTAISADNNLLVYQSSENKIKVININTRQTKFIFKPEADVRDLRFIGNSKIAVLYGDGSIGIWDLTKRNKIRKYPDQKTSLRSSFYALNSIFANSKNDSLLAVLAYFKDGLDVRTLNTLEEVNSFSTPDLKGLIKLEYSSDNYLWGLINKRQIREEGFLLRKWNMARADTDLKIEINKQKVSDFSVSPDGKQVAVSIGSMIYFYSGNNGILEDSILVNGSIGSLKYVKNAESFATSQGFAPPALVYTVGNKLFLKPIRERQTPIRELTSHNARINDFYLSNDGKYILTASNDKTIKVLETNDFQLINTFEEDLPIEKVQCSPGNNFITFTLKKRISPIIKQNSYTIGTIDFKEGRKLFELIESANGADFNYLENKEVLITSKGWDGLRFWDLDIENILLKSPQEEIIYLTPDQIRRYKLDEAIENGNGWDYFYDNASGEELYNFALFFMNRANIQNTSKEVEDSFIKANTLLKAAIKKDNSYKKTESILLEKQSELLQNINN